MNIQYHKMGSFKTYAINVIVHRHLNTTALISEKYYSNSCCYTTKIILSGCTISNNL